MNRLPDYERVPNSGAPDDDSAEGKCYVEDCERPRYRGRRLCTYHAWRQQKHGDVIYARPEHESRESRFWRNVTKTAACWYWRGNVTNEGYGVFGGGPHRIAAHRWSYQHHKGQIPEGLVIDHLCRVRRCVNPEHMEVVTSVENVMRGFGLTARNATKTHCTHGHEFTLENTRIHIRSNGRTGRSCRSCEYLNQRARREQAHATR